MEVYGTSYAFIIVKTAWDSASESSCLSSRCYHNSLHSHRASELLYVISGSEITYTLRVKNKATELKAILPVSRRITENYLFQQHASD